MNICFSAYSVWDLVFFTNFAIADRKAEVRSGFERRDADILESVYLRSFLTIGNLVNFKSLSGMRQTVDVKVDMYIPPTASTRALAIGVFKHVLREASAVCSFNSDGQYQSLRLWNGQRYGSHAFFINNRRPAMRASRQKQNGTLR